MMFPFLEALQESEETVSDLQDDNDDLQQQIITLKYRIEVRENEIHNLEVKLEATEENYKEEIKILKEEHDANVEDMQTTIDNQEVAKDKIDEAFQDLLTKLSDEEDLRQRTPALKEAWDHYQVILGLSNE